MSYLFTSESVSEGHPDKVADQISDALLDEFLAYDKTASIKSFLGIFKEDNSSCKRLIKAFLLFIGKNG